ncbi:MAG: ATP phosphoribosyltransferase regulatory subunit [Hyphomicrobium sp.]|nr:ATP phosphoribosyltransferase regulatory subunit [Hyphomicrobium sp.]
MGAKTPRDFEALEAQAQILLSVFIAAGHEAVAPPAIQPAAVFLDVVGESLRGRTYVFTDLDGEELCLRPDLTVPTCRLYLERHSNAEARARYCYNGTAFRFQPEGADAAHPREFRQAGIESFGDLKREEAEAQTFALVLSALQQAGLRTWQLRIGDLGLFDAVLAAAEMPERWRRRLRHQFGRHEAFRAELKSLTTHPARSAAAVPAAVLDALEPNNPAGAEQRVGDYLDSAGIELTGTRSLTEVTDGLLSITADAKAKPLNAATAAMIDAYVDVAAPARTAGEHLRKLLGKAGPDVADALDAFERRIGFLEGSGVDMSTVDFSAEFGPNLAYYTGFVFEVVAPSLGTASPVAGGGRYDSLLKAVGAPCQTPAVGGAIHTERLLALVSGGKR